MIVQYEIWVWFIGVYLSTDYGYNGLAVAICVYYNKLYINYTKDRILR